ncbi:MAG: hypothetical protein AB7C97_09070, partial [Oscillospiraceae bacterium]
MAFSIVHNTREKKENPARAGLPVATGRACLLVLLYGVQSAVTGMTRAGAAECSPMSFSIQIISY